MNIPKRCVFLKARLSQVPLVALHAVFPVRFIWKRSFHERVATQLQLTADHNRAASLTGGQLKVKHCPTQFACRAASPSVYILEGQKLTEAITGELYSPMSDKTDTMSVESTDRGNRDGNHTRTGGCNNASLRALGLCCTPILVLARFGFNPHHIQLQWHSSRARRRPYRTFRFQLRIRKDAF